MGWKTAQSKRKNSQKVKLAIIILGIIFSLLFLSQAFKFSKVFFAKSKWDGQSNINVVLKSDLLSLLSYNIKAQKVTIIDIPDKTYVMVPRGYGSWLIGSIYPLGGGKLLADSATSFFGIPVVGFLETSLNKLTDKNPLSNFGIFSIKGSLPPFDVLRLKMGLSSVRFDKIKRLDLEDLGLLDKDKLADGTQILTSDPTRLDSLSDYFVEPSFKAERKTIAVFNSTSHPLLAQKAARIISNIGGDVIITSNSEIKLEKSQILGEEGRTLSILKQIFEVNGTIEPKLEEFSSRASINLFLGEDYYKTQ